MIELHRTYPDAESDAIEERLREMVLAYRVVRETGSGDGESSGVETPVIVQSGQTYRGVAEIDRFLDELHAELTLGRQFQSDACYLDPDDPTRCL
ncbi:MAG TPA: hypothetical protein VF190_02145 [Rhodothermales bacterium]